MENVPSIRLLATNELWSLKCVTNLFTNDSGVAFGNVHSSSKRASKPMEPLPAKCVVSFMNMSSTGLLSSYEILSSDTPSFLYSSSSSSKMCLLKKNCKYSLACHDDESSECVHVSSKWQR